MESAGENADIGSVFPVVDSVDGKQIGVAIGSALNGELTVRFSIPDVDPSEYVFEADVMTQTVTATHVAHTEPSA